MLVPKKQLVMLNGKQVPMHNFGADPAKEGFNRWGMSAKTWNELGSADQRSIVMKAHLNGLTISAAGYEHALTVLTQIKAKATRQTFYEINPSDFMPVVVGEGAWMENLVFNSVYMDAGDFERGFVDTSSINNRKPTTNIKIIAKPSPLQAWNNAFTYSIIDVEKAARGNVDYVTELENARKKLWDLGIQRIAFLGSKTRSDIYGLYTMESVSVNNTFITAPISGLTGANFQTFVAGILKLYAENTASTKLPNRFCMPQADFLGMAAAASETYPMIDKITYLENAFKRICGGDFKITNTAYGNKTQMATAGVTGYRYLLYRDDPETLELNIPVAYTTTAFGTANGFDFENVAMGQFGGVFGRKTQEVMYFDDTQTA
jgi:hypothetical protein